MEIIPVLLEVEQMVVAMVQLPMLEVVVVIQPLQLVLKL